SGTDYKRWPLENYISLAKKLKTLKNVNILFLVGPDESEMTDYIRIKGFPVLQSENIGIVMGVINNCNYFISNDSGMMHVSALLGRKIITIWGGTDEKRNGARSKSVFNIINPDVLCRPCVKFIPRNKTFSCQFECLSQTKAIDVFNLIIADIKKGKESHES
ncbi:MAG: glycosyltransferase family 9 protein, partial [Calditrichaeota bacterium]|nr:glycosyltransferase family 9 protein [Calditrichota bacterium]